MLSSCCLVTLIWVTCLPITASNYFYHPLITPETDHTYIEGDVMIGGLIAIRDAGGVNNLNCNDNISSFGMQRLEAMRYAVDKINNDDTLLKGIQLGLEIRDSCGSETKALDESLQFVIDRVPVCTKVNKTKKMFGVVGTGMSLLTGQVANLLRLFKIPLVCYGATSVELSDKSKYDFLLRTVPPDNFQSDAMVDFITQELNWKSVFVLYSTGSYGEHGFRTFITSVSKRPDNDSICIVDAVKMTSGENVNAIAEVIRQFNRSEHNIRGIVCYCEAPDVHTIIQAIEMLGLTEHYRIIGSDTWITGAKTNKSIIFSLHYNQSDLQDFYDGWYKKLNPLNVNKKQNPWFKDFWNYSCNQVQNEQPGITLNCSDYNTTLFALCKTSNPNTMQETCRRDDKISYIIDAVYAYAHAMDNLYKVGFDSNKAKFMTVDLGGRFFMDDFLSKVEFAGVSGPVNFNDSTSRGYYDINQYNENGVLRKIGTWNSGKLFIKDKWRESLHANFVNSNCQQRCSINSKRIISSKSCCWTCRECKKNEYLITVGKCMPCEPGEKPNANFTGCYSLPLKHIDTGWKILISVFVMIGIIITVFTMLVFLHYGDTPLVKASGRELSFLLLTGILMLYLISISFIIYPTQFTCGIGRFSLGTCLCLCYASLLTKTNRIARIFSGRQALLFLTPKWQVTLTLFLLTPQVLLAIIGIVRDKPKPVIVPGFEEYRIIKCYVETPDLIGSIVYNLILVALCTYYAFKTRKVPANFNEARFIGFVMYTTCVLWVAFIPVFIGTSEEYRTIFIMLDLIINATTLLVGLFGIKMYIILLRPDKNSRTNSKLRSVTFFSEGSAANYSIDGCDANLEKFTGKSSPSVVMYDKNSNARQPVIIAVNSTNKPSPKLKGSNKPSPKLKGNNKPSPKLKNGHFKHVENTPESIITKENTKNNRITAKISNGVIESKDGSLVVNSHHKATQCKSLPREVKVANGYQKFTQQLTPPSLNRQSTL